MKRRKLAKLTSFGARGVASIADQSAAAAISFLASVFIGRQLGAEALGVYAITTVFVFLIRALQSSVLLEPMSVFGAKKSREEMPRYFGFLLGMEGVIVGICSVLVAVVSAGVYFADLIQRDLLYALIASAVYASLVAFQYFLRRQFYIDQRQYLATIQSVSYLLLVAAGLLIMWRLDGLTVVDVYTLLSVCSIAVCVVQGGRFWRNVGRPTRADCRRYAADHWSYGKWVLLGVPLAILVYQGYFFIVGSLLSTEAAGQLKAVDTLVAPFAQVSIGLNLMLLPITSRGIERMTLSAQQTHAIRMAMPLIALSLFYGAAVFFGGGYALRALFGDSVRDAVPLVEILAFVPLFRALPLPASVVLSALQRANLRFISQSLAVFATFAIAVPLVLMYGLIGAAIGMLMSLVLYTLSQWACLFWLWRRMARQRPALLAAQASGS